MAPSRALEQGFTLLETLIAFSIASLFLVVMFKGLAVSSAASRDARMVEGAVSRARSHLASAAATGDVGERDFVQTGTDGPDYRWRVEIRPAGRKVTVRPGGLAGQAPIRDRWDLYHVTSIVDWDAAGRRHSVTLETDRLGTSVVP